MLDSDWGKVKDKNYCIVTVNLFMTIPGNIHAYSLSNLHEVPEHWSQEIYADLWVPCI